jgi:hypothetical protein
VVVVPQAVATGNLDPEAEDQEECGAQEERPEAQVELLVRRNEPMDDIVDVIACEQVHFAITLGQPGPRGECRLGERNGLGEKESFKP